MNRDQLETTRYRFDRPEGVVWVVIRPASDDGEPVVLVTTDPAPGEYRYSLRRPGWRYHFRINRVCVRRTVTYTQGGTARTVIWHPHKMAGTSGLYREDKPGFNISQREGVGATLAGIALDVLNQFAREVPWYHVVSSRLRICADIEAARSEWMGAQSIAATWEVAFRNQEKALKAFDAKWRAQ